MAKIIFGSCPQASPEQVMEDFRLDAQDEEWDTPTYMVLGNSGTGSAIMVSEIEEMHLISAIAAELKPLLDEVTWVALYLEGYGQSVPESESMDSAAAKFAQRDKSKDDEAKLIYLISKDYSVMDIYSRSKESWSDKPNDGDEIYDPRSNMGEQLALIRKEMDW